MFGRNAEVMVVFPFAGSPFGKKLPKGLFFDSKHMIHQEKKLGGLFFSYQL